MRKIIKNPLFILVLLSVVVHWYVFLDTGYLNSGDWIHVPDNLLKEQIFSKIWGGHFSLGEPLVVIYNLPFYWLASFLINLSGFFNWDVFVRIFFILPIVFLTPISGYLLNLKITKNRTISFFSSLFYIFNPFFLRLNLDWLTYAYMWWILPILLLLNILFRETKKEIFLLLNSLIVFIGFVVELRIMILIMATIFLFNLIEVINNFRRKKQIDLYKYFLLYLSYIIGLVGHLFWIIPFTLGLGADIKGVVSVVPFFSFYSIIDALTLRPYQWKNNLLGESFEVQNIDLRYFVSIFITLLGLIKAKSYKIKKSSLLFLIFLFGLSVTLIKQNKAPLGFLYTLFFKYLPLFNLYRESSKFFILAALPISIFFGIGASHIYQKIKTDKNKKGLILFFLTLFFITVFNSQNLFTQQMGRMSKGVDIPLEYLNLEEKIIEENEYYRILWIPRTSRWSYYSNTNPKVDFSRIINSNWQKPNELEVEEKLPSYKSLEKMVEKDVLENYLNISSIKYVIVPFDSENDFFFKNYAARDKFVDLLDQQDFLKRVPNYKNMDVWINQKFLPHIYLTNEEIGKENIEQIKYIKVQVTAITPANYKIKIKNLEERTYLNFSESYHSGWKVYENYDWKRDLLEKNNLNEKIDHYENEFRMNTFVLDPELLCKTSSCDLEFELIFSPNKYLKLGLVISVVTIPFYIAFILIVYFLRKKNEK